MEKKSVFFCAVCTKRTRSFFGLKRIAQIRGGNVKLISKNSGMIDEVSFVFYDEPNVCG